MPTENQTTTTTPQAPVTPAAPATPTGGAQQPVTPAQVVTPAAPAATTPAAAAPTTPSSSVPEAVFGEAITYQSTGNSNLDTALKWAGSIGLDIDTSTELQQAVKGDFGPLRALLAAKQVPGAEAYIALAEAGYQNIQQTKQATEQAVQQMVVEAAGSAEQWAEVFNWAADNADQAEKDQINYAFEKGGFLAEAVAFALVSNFRKANGTQAAPASPVQSTAAPASPAGQGALSPVEYGRAVQDLRLSMPGKSIEGTPEYKALQTRRMAYRAR